MIVALLLSRGGRDGGLRTGFGPCLPRPEGGDDEDGCPSVLGVRATDWGTWAFLCATLVAKEALLAYGYTTYRFWVANEVMDRKSCRPIDTC